MSRSALSTALRAALAVSLGLLATGAPAQDGDGDADLLILHINDFHGQVRPRRLPARGDREARWIGGFAALAEHTRRRRAAFGKTVWVTNGGDWFQGTPEGNHDRGVAAMQTLERLGLTASVVGNHEYDFGERSLIALIEALRHPVLGANVLERGSERVRPYVRPYTVRTVTGAGGVPVRIAIVGLVTEDTPQVATGPFGSAVFETETATLERLWPQLMRDAEHVVLLTHSGLRRDIELAQRFPGIRLILGGHSHTLLRRAVVEGDTTIVQSGSRAGAVTEVEVRLTVDRFECAATTLVELDGAIEPDTDTRAHLDRTFGHLAEHWDTPIGEVAGAADRRWSGGSTPAGSYVAGLIRAASDADVGLTNKGGLRSTLVPGAITRRDVFELLPFDNSVVTFELSGTQLRRVLAQSLEQRRRPLEIDGATYTYRIEDGTRQLRDVLVGGRPLDLERNYRVATNSFLAGGGDGQTAFAEQEPVGRTEQFLRDLMEADLLRSTVIELPGESRIQLESR